MGYRVVSRSSRDAATPAWRRLARNACGACPLALAIPSCSSVVHGSSWASRHLSIKCLHCHLLVVALCLHLVLHRREQLGIKALVFGGENEDWPAPQVRKHMLAPPPARPPTAAALDLPWVAGRAAQLLLSCGISPGVDQRQKSQLLLAAPTPLLPEATMRPMGGALLGHIPALPC